jgi:hypothetical protein
MKGDERRWREKKDRRGKDSRGRRRRIYGVTKSTEGNMMMSFVHRKAAQFKDKPWQILQISLTPTPGILKLWVLSADGDLAAMRLSVIFFCFMCTLLPAIPTIPAIFRHSHHSRRSCHSRRFRHFRRSRHSRPVIARLLCYPAIPPPSSPSCLSLLLPS